MKKIILASDKPNKESQTLLAKIEFKTGQVEQIQFKIKKQDNQ